ncbi:MAG: GMC family oxidoreductase [Rhodococcus sp. (in: high G+C Gram-positive bacteria)]|uniref:GMC family oxidoreductase n=1 Tax=Rhodococcus sp. TaxID=1831 RepID=UPI002AD9F32D|nr:GMC family oxidoreductase [Rhodococcus sp. (in: high G+C Gram-positive bacteria)]
MATEDRDFDWIVIGSGFGGSVAALRLAEKGYRVAVFERGRHYEDGDLPTSTQDRRRFLWMPSLGFRGIMHNRLFGHVFSSSQTGVGGGSLVYGGVLFRPQNRFYDDPQWQGLRPWKSHLDRHFQTAEQMLGVASTPWESATMELSREMATAFGRADGFAPAPVGVFFGMPGKTVPDPYFGGDGPDRTGCTRCGRCMVGCRVGAANRLTKNYLWFAEKLAVDVISEREVRDVTPIGAPDGSDGYRVTTRRPSRHPFDRGNPESVTAHGVVFAAGAIGTNELMAACKARGSLPRISDRLGKLVRTNSEAVMTVLLPADAETWRDVAASSRVMVDQDTQVELLTYGPQADFMRFLFTALTGPGTRGTRIASWLSGSIRHPRRWGKTLSSGWSRRTIMMLVMQARDNAIEFTPKRRVFGTGYRLVTSNHGERPAPTYLHQAHAAATWLADRTGGIAQSSVFEALGNRPMTAHVVGGAPIGASSNDGVVDCNLQVFGYRNMIVCDAAALPANPGVNPALTITALAEHALDRIPEAAQWHT